jgi:hypothetical protein
MKRRAPFVIACGSAALVFAIGAACTFPDVAFAPAVDGAADAELDAHVLIDGAEPDALIVRDAGMKIDAAGCAATECDCDMDGFRDTLKLNCDGGANDCDDHDPRARPGQGFLLDKAESPMFGNWDCSSKVDKLYPDAFDCTTLAPGDACNGGVGFTGQPECGAVGDLVKCKTKPGIGIGMGMGIGDTCIVGTHVPGTQQACK